MNFHGLSKPGHVFKFLQIKDTNKGANFGLNHDQFLQLEMPQCFLHCVGRLTPICLARLWAGREITGAVLPVHDPVSDVEIRAFSVELFLISPSWFDNPLIALQSKAKIFARTYKTGARGIDTGEYT